MTNAEKFVEVFGTELKRHYAIKSWWEQEFVPPKTGHWIENAPEYQNIDPPYICSECGNMHLRKTNYCDQCGCHMVEPQESDHKCHTCKHYTSGDNDGSCGSYICKGYSNWESEEQA